MSNAPWWFASVVGFAGVITGIILKWLVDIRVEKAKARREDRLRFLDEKYAKYTRFVAVTNSIMKAHTTIWTNQQILRRLRSENREGVSTEEYEKVFREQKEIQAEGYREAEKLLYDMRILAPGRPYLSASRCMDELMSGSRSSYDAAEREMLNAFRKDLGIEVLERQSEAVLEPGDYSKGIIAQMALESDGPWTLVAKTKLPD